MYRVQPDSVVTGLIGFVPTRYAAQQLTFQDATACQNNTMRVMASAIQTPLYEVMEPRSRNPLGGEADASAVYSSAEQKLWKVEPGFPGVYSVTISSNSPYCFPTVYGYGGAQVVVGFIQDYSTADKPLPYAVYGKVNFPVFHIMDRNNGPSNVERLTMANFYVQSFYVEFIRLTLLQQLLQATLAPTPKTIQFDILFIVDETEDEKFIPDVAEKFIENIMEFFTPSQRRARVGLITMPQKEKKSMLVAFLSSIDSFEALDQNLVSLEDFNIEGDKEYIVQALHFANDPNKFKKKENGYRDHIDNHLIVILTAKSNITDIDGDMTEIDNISKDASYGIIAVGYNHGQTAADWTDVKKLASGDCSQIVANKDELMGSTVDFIQSSIWNATFNGGLYCSPAN